MSGALATMIGLPLAMLLMLAHRPLRRFVIGGLCIAPLPGLLALPAIWQERQRDAIDIGIGTLTLDRPGALMLVASSLLWCFAGFAASRWLRGRSGQDAFAMWWLLTLVGSLGVFIAADVASFYLFYAAASLPAYGLIVFGGADSDRRAGRITLIAALLGEGVILAAFVMMVAGAAGQGLLIRDLVGGLAQSPMRDPVIALVILGFGLKIGLVPLHGWMPLSYSAGPLVATAVLSGATSKAGIIGLIRFLPLESPQPAWGLALLVAGLFSALYGAAVGIAQITPRSVLAYSSVSQLGQMAAGLGLGLATGNSAAAVLVAFYAVYHVLTKGSLFLLLGTQAGVRGGAAARIGLIAAAILSLGFAGLPLTGGAFGKLAMKPLIGAGMSGTVFALAAIGSTLMMLHFIELRHRREADCDAPQAQATTVAWLATALAAMVLPWAFFASATGQDLTAATNLDALVELAWPVAAGAALWWGSRRAGLIIPHVAAGDILGPTLAWCERRLQAGADAIARLERQARVWSVSAVCLMLVIAALFLLLW